MKKNQLIFTLLFCVMTIMNSLAQAPTGMNYQAVARSSNGQEMANKSIAVKISILAGSTSGNADYVEKHSVSTNQFGLFSLVIGSGSAQTGTFSGISWSSGSKFLKVEVDTNNGNSFTTLSNTQLMSVPYALYAEKSGSGSSSGLTGNGTSNYITKYNTASTLTTSLLYDNGTSIGLGTTSPNSNYHFQSTGSLQVSGSFESNNNSVNSIGVQGIHTGSGSYNAKGVYGKSKPNGSWGIGGHFEGGWVGSLGESINGGDSNYIGIYGNASTGVSTSIGQHIGVRGRSLGTKGIHYGGFFQASSDSSAHAVVGGSFVNTHRNLTDIYEVGNAGGYFISNDGQGVFGEANGSFTIGSNNTKVSVGTFGYGHDASGTYNIGVLAYGQNGGTASTGLEAYGDEGSTNSSYVIGVNSSVTGTGTTGTYAGYFDGDVTITGNIAKAGGSFKIDHPQDPANKYLIHSFVESPDMMNIYNGNIVTDANGVAIVDLPSYFMAENKDFRYQLTVVGTFAQAIVAEEVKDNKFTIKTDKPNVKVSWQVTGIRADEWANKNRIVAEVEKPAKEKGYYLHPELFGKSKELSIPSLTRSQKHRGHSTTGNITPLLTPLKGISVSQN